MNKIGIMLLEDNRLLRESISGMIKKQTDMRVVAILSNGDDILHTDDKLKPDIILLDLGIRDKTNLKMVKLIKEQFRDAKIIVMDLMPKQSDVFEFVQAGVSGFILKEATSSEFIKTIRTVNKGTKVLPKLLTGLLFTQIIEHAINGTNNSPADHSIHMTNRERQVIELIAEGLTNKEIAVRLNLSTYTVKSHVHNILEKLSLSTRVQIAKHAHLTEFNKSTLAATSLIEE